VTSRWVNGELGCGERKHRHRPGRVLDGAQEGGATGVVVLEHPAVEPELVGHAVEGQDEPQVADEPLVRSEDRGAQARVQPVRPDHQVEPSPAAPGEDDVDPVGVLGELGDPVAEDVLDVVAGVLVEHPGQISAQDLDLRDVPVAAVVVGAERLQHGAVRIHGVRARGVGAGRPHRRIQPHQADDLLGHPARVHRLPAGAQPGCPLHHGDLGTPPVQPVGQRGPRDARPRHQHPDPAHSTPVRPVQHPQDPTPVRAGTHRYGAGSGKPHSGPLRP
jgi:hypothetical protein